MASFMRPFESQAYAAFRIVTGLLFLWHGCQKLFGFPEPMPPGSPRVHRLRRGSDRADRRRARDDRPVHELGRVPVQRLDGRSPTGWVTGSASMARSRSSRASTTASSRSLYCFAFLFISARGAGIWSVDGTRSSASTRVLPGGSGAARGGSLGFWPLWNAAARLPSVSTSVSEPIRFRSSRDSRSSPGFTPSRVRLPVSLVRWSTEASRSGRDPCHTRERVPGSERENQVKKIYVGNLPWGASEADLRDFFSTVGEVHSVAVITDRETGRSRGFGVRGNGRRGRR